MRRAMVLAAAYMAGAVPFSNLLAGRHSGVDLRGVGTGTVSGTSLYRVAGFRALALAGVLDIAKGASVPAAARLMADAEKRGDARSRPARTFSDAVSGPTSARRQPPWRPPSGLESAAAGLVVAGHNWSPYLDGAGGRGIAPALGAYSVIAPEGAVLLLAGLTIGRLAHHSGLGTLAGQLGLVPMLSYTRGRGGATAGVAVLLPMLAKRVVGNGRPSAGLQHAYWARLLFDRDNWSTADIGSTGAPSASG